MKLFYSVLKTFQNFLTASAAQEETVEISLDKSGNLTWQNSKTWSLVTINFVSVIFNLTYFSLPRNIAALKGYISENYLLK